LLRLGFSSVLSRLGFSSVLSRFGFSRVLSRLGVVASRRLPVEEEGMPRGLRGVVEGELPAFGSTRRRS